MLRRVFLLSSGAFLAGCSSLRVERDYDVSVDFSTLRTFAWRHAEQPETGVPRVDNDLVDQRVRAAVEAELAARGMREVNPEDADCWIEYFITFKQRIDSTGGMTVGMGRGSYGRAGSVGYSTAGNVSDYEEAAITIDVLSPGDAKTIWRGLGSRRSTSTKNPEKITARVNDAVKRVLAGFPPG